MCVNKCFINHHIKILKSFHAPHYLMLRNLKAQLSVRFALTCVVVHEKLSSIKTLLGFMSIYSYFRIWSLFKKMFNISHIDILQTNHYLVEVNKMNHFVLNLAGPLIDVIASEFSCLIKRFSILFHINNLKNKWPK